MQRVKNLMINQKISVSLLRKEKGQYFPNLNEKRFTDNKKLWQTVELFLSDKLYHRERIALADNEELVLQEKNILGSPLKTLFQVLSKIYQNITLEIQFIKE